MKTLKFEHDLARLIAIGKKTATWRLFDDKDLSVGDVIRVIDKVDRGRPETWKAIGTAHINTVIQKRLADIEASDYEGHEPFLSKHEMLKTYQKYYGPDVSFDTVVKIIRFRFDNNSISEEERVVDNTINLTEVKLFADGGSRGNPGPSAWGFAILDMTDQLVVKKGTYIGITTNNQAEYQALKAGLEEAAQMHIQVAHVFMDSLLVINQMQGIFKVKNRDLWPIHAAIKDMLTKFKKVSFTHVPRQLNKIADSAVNEALDHAARH